jgi:CubicO group peptidase (beta-lactamase class C family)
VVEAASGTDYRSFVTHNLFRPVGMTRTTSGLFPSSGHAVGLTRGRPIHPSPRLTELPGTGDLWTTAGDLLRYADAVSSGTILSGGAWDLMCYPHAMVEEPESGGLARAAYGLGTFIGTLDGKPACFHTGDNPGYVSILVWLPRDGVTLAVLANDDSVSIGTVAGQLARGAER